jgi:hypothetical protein
LAREALEVNLELRICVVKAKEIRTKKKKNKCIKTGRYAKGTKALGALAGMSAVAKHALALLVLPRIVYAVIVLVLLLLMGCLIILPLLLARLLQLRGCCGGRRSVRELLLSVLC